jgi:hypothetical protein
MADRLLARLQSLVGYVPTAWSLVRIACFGLLVVTLVVPPHPGDTSVSPYNRVNGSDHSRVVSLPYGDTRGFRPTSHKHAFRIAWIGGSEMLGVKPGHVAVVPGLVNDRIGAVDGRRTQTDIYFLNAIRLADELAALHRALATKPDMVVISLNPVWVLNDLAVQQWGYLDGLIARGSIWPPSSWPVAASLVSPGDVGWKALSSVSGAVNDRLFWGTKFTAKTSNLSFLDKVVGGTEPPLTDLGKLALRRPVDFWHEHYSAAPQGSSLTATQLSILKRGVSSESSMNNRVLQEMFATARRAGVDTYFYMPAIAPQVFAEPQGTRDIRKLQQMLAETTKGETNSRVVFDPKGLQDRVPAVPYKDIIHKLDPIPEVKLLTGDLCALLERRGHKTECEAP